MTGLYIPMQGPATLAYNDLIKYYSLQDYHAHYIRTFQLMLSPMIKKDFLVNDPDYRDVTSTYPLPDADDPCQYLPAEGFRLYIMMFERIMRNHNIIGGFDAEERGPDSVGDTTIDVLSEYVRKDRKNR